MRWPRRRDVYKRQLEKLFPDEFVHIQDDDYIDYVYLREKLARLNGKKLQSKRNHINRFEATYPDYCYLPITTDDLEPVSYTHLDVYKRQVYARRWRSPLSSSPL